MLSVLIRLDASVATAAPDELLTGRKLVVEDGRAARRRGFELVSTDPGIAPGLVDGGPGDPVLHGGSLRVVSSVGEVFDDIYDLPRTRWAYIGRKGENHGYRLRSPAPPVRTVVVRPGKLLHLLSRGQGLGHLLGSDPDPVQIVLTLGTQQYCLSFGGTVHLTSGRKYLATGAPAPAVCPLPYAEDRMWLCRPGMATNQCLVNRLDATEVRPDASTAVEPHTGSEEHPYDCFYVYPTVDLSDVPGNHTDLSDVTLMLDPLLSQAARFNGSCRIFAPLYRQATLGTYGTPDAARFFAIASDDVEAAFRRYLARDNGGRPFVVIGHSQGAEIMAGLLEDIVDPSPALRARLIVALLIGGDVVVPEGAVVGGSFQNLPLCTTREQTGCVIAYRSYAEGLPPANGSNVRDPVMDTACTNPAALGGGSEGRFSAAFFPTVVRQPLYRVWPDPGFGTPFTVYEDFYAAACVKDDRGKSYLQIRVRPRAGDRRTNPIPFADPVFSPARLGLHILDYDFALGDLIGLVETKATGIQ